MLKGISPLLSPELDGPFAHGHGDEIVLADAHFPGETFNGRVIRADGLRILIYWTLFCPCSRWTNTTTPIWS